MAKPIDFKKLTRKDFLRELVAFGAEQRMLVEAAVSGFAVGAQATLDRRARVKARGGFRFFCETYFPHFIDPGVAPSIFQLWAYDVPQMLVDHPGARQAVAAPRGEGKSTILVQLHALWRIVNGYSHYMPLIMDAAEQAEMMLDTIKAELEANARLLQDYPECVGQGVIWRANKIITGNGVMVEAFGAAKRIRGRRFSAFRPDCVFIDDFENDVNVRSKDWRDQREGKLRKEIANLGPPNGSMVQMYVGTILFPDSVLARTLKNPRWKGRSQTFPSIHTWPDRMDLWDQWEERMLNESEDSADEFFREHEAAMLAGALVSWPAMRSLLQLMKLRTEDHHAFDTEHQHNPVDPEGHPFVGCISYWVHVKKTWIYLGSHDPSMGKHSRRGDPSATLVGAVDRESGVLSVVEALIARRVPGKQIADIIRLQGEYNCVRWGVEGIAFQEFFRQQLVVESAKVGVPVPAIAIINSTDKDMRIEAIHPHMANALILLDRRQKTLIEHLEIWPDGEYDDGPDALEMLWQMARRYMHGGASSLRVGRRSQAGEMMQGYGV
jgi:predicted phage terminase large subunit-like protein